MSGEEGQEFKIGKSAANKPLNRFRNITPCEFKCMILAIHCVAIYLNHDIFAYNFQLIFLHIHDKN